MTVRVSLKPLNRQAAAPGDIRLGIARGIWAVLRDVGADPEQVIAEGGHDPRIFDGSENFLSHAALGGSISTAPSAPTAPILGFVLERKQASARWGSWVC